MQTNQRRANTPAARYWSTGEKRRKAPKKTGYAAYHGIDDFLKAFPVATMNRYGEPIISGIRIC
jgi:hypothetical protein